MRRYLLIILASTACFLGSSIGRADDLVSETVSPQDAHLQLVNQALDNIESSFNNQTIASQPVVNSINTVNNQNTPVLGGLNPRRNEFEFSPELYWAKYDAPKAMNQHGFLTGYNAKYSYRILNEPDWAINMFRLQAQWASGKFDTQPSNQGPSGIKDKTFDLRGVVGKDIYPYANLRTTGYFGYGYRYLKDNSEGLTTTIGPVTFQGDRRYSHYYYLPLGADIVYQKNSQYSVESNLEYDYLIRGRQVDELGDFGFPGYGTLVVAQKDGEGLRASIRLNYYFKYCTAFAETFYRYWHISESKSKPDPNVPGATLYEPKNNTEEFGMRFGLEI